MVVGIVIIVIIIIINQDRIQSYGRKGAGCPVMQTYKCNLPFLRSHIHPPKKKQTNDFTFQ